MCLDKQEFPSPPHRAFGHQVSVVMTHSSSGHHLWVPEVLLVLFLTVTHCRQGRLLSKIDLLLILLHHLFNLRAFRQVSESLPGSVSSPIKHLAFQSLPELNEIVHVEFYHVFNKWQLLLLKALYQNYKDLIFQMKKLRGKTARFKMC